MNKLINKIQTAWKTKQMLAAQTALGAILMTVYGLDIQPIIEQIESAWVAVVGVLVGLGVTGVGKD